jgi:hypothetical protein
MESPGKLKFGFVGELMGAFATNYIIHRLLSYLCQYFKYITLEIWYDEKEAKSQLTMMASSLDEPVLHTYLHLSL